MPAFRIAVVRRSGATRPQSRTAAVSRARSVEMKRSAISAERFGISDVCRSVAEANMGGGFCIKAFARYAVLYDVIIHTYSDRRKEFLEIKAIFLRCLSFDF